jgi:hypothetical protein
VRRDHAAAAQFSFVTVLLRNVWLIEGIVNGCDLRAFVDVIE